jgi:VWFA-related protein
VEAGLKINKMLCVVTAVLLLGVVVFAQEKPDKPPAEKAPTKQFGGLHFLDVSEVTVVNVDVTVSDKKGPVLGLKPEDFEVYQDGKLQPVTNFAIYMSTVLAQPTPAPTVAPVPTAAAATPTPVLAPPSKREPRFLVLYVDNENLQPMNRNRVLGKVIEWVVGHLEPPDQAMVVSYQRSLKVLQPFTSNVDEVAAALRVVKKYTGGGSDIASSRQRVEDYIHQNSSNQSTLYSAMDQVKSFAREQHNNLTFAVRSLQEVVGTMSGLPGKRAIIYISDGLAMTPGLELYYEIEDAYSANNANVLSESRDYAATDLFQGLVHTAASAGVTLYTLDARGLQSDSGISAENSQSRSPLAAGMMTSNYQDSLIYMADHTGGLAILNANDPTPGLNKIAADFETYYSLGYRLIPTGEDRAHRIQVKVNGHPEYRLNYRTMFIEKALPTRIGERVMSGLSYELEDNPLGVELKTGIPAPADNGRWTLPVEVSFPLEKVALIPDGDDLVGYVMVYYAARDDEGKQSDLQRTEHQVKIPAPRYEKARHQLFTVSTSLLLEPGRYRISVGVRDELTNQAGYALARTPVHPESK